MKRYSTKEHWEKFWAGIGPNKRFKPHYYPLIKSLLPSNEKWTCFEVGCVPGNYLKFFHEHFKYRPAGIDYSDRIELVKQYFAGLKIPIELYNKDFFEFKPKKQYNVVISNGFVEHFGNPEFVFRKHLNLVAKGGWLIVSLPNFCNTQYYLHNLLDAETLKTHNLDTMNPKLWRRLAEKNKMKISYCDYYETYDFWIINKSPLMKPIVLAIRVASRAIRFMLKITGVLNIPNKYLSPHIVLIAQKT